MMNVQKKKPGSDRARPVVHYLCWQRLFGQYQSAMIHLIIVHRKFVEEQPRFLLSIMQLTSKREPCSHCEQFDTHSETCPFFPVSLTRELFKTLGPFPCNPLQYLKVYVTRYCAMTYGEHFSGREADLSQEIVLKLIEKVEIKKRFTTLTDLRTYLIVISRNHVIDEFRKDRGMLQCGYCLSYENRKCSLADTGANLPHPHYDRELDYSQVPHKLQPPCREFRSRKGARDVDLESHADRLPSPQANPERVAEKTEQERIIHHVLSILAGKSIRMSFVIRRLFFEEATPAEVAAELKISKKTVLRDRKDAIHILKQDLSSLTFNP